MVELQPQNPSQSAPPGEPHARLRRWLVTALLVLVGMVLLPLAGILPPLLQGTTLPPTATPRPSPSATATEVFVTATFLPTRTRTPTRTLTPTATRVMTYKVRQGDILGLIARELGVTVKALAETNGLTEPYIIQPGQVLTIPASSP